MTLTKLLSTLLITIYYAIHNVHSLVLYDNDLPPEIYPHIGASFGPSPRDYNVTAPIVLSDPLNLCEPSNRSLNNSIVLVVRGDCFFDSKVLHAQNAGALGVIIGDINDYFEQQQMVADYGDNDELSINIPSIMCMKSTYLHMLNILKYSSKAVSSGLRHSIFNKYNFDWLDKNTTLYGTLDIQGLLFMPNDENTADDVFSEFAMIYPILYCLYSFKLFVQVYKQHRNEERQRIQQQQNNNNNNRQNNNNNNHNQQQQQPGNINNNQYEHLSAAATTALQQPTILNVNVQPMNTNSSTTSSNGSNNSTSSSLANLPLGVNDMSNDTPRTALLHAHNTNPIIAQQLTEQQRRYNRVVHTLRTVNRLTQPNTMFNISVIVYGIWFVTSCILSIISWSESDCVINMRWMLVLRMCTSYLGIRHAYNQTHSEIDNEPYLDKAQHLVWWSMIAFNGAWLLMSPADAHKCSNVAPLAFISVNIMFYITLCWIALTTLVHMLVHSSYLQRRGLLLVVLRCVYKYLQLGWILCSSVDRHEPVTQLELEYLPTIKYVKGMFKRDDDTEEPSCAICMCEYSEGDLIRQLSCNHHFGKECIDSWLTIKSSCPTCRTNVLSNLTDTNNNAQPQLFNPEQLV